ncbi:hypothetical protein [uncultured Helicobacter sp.]|uniref:hypothetical protein n=1 Tax=uncultured Helicobacter sp. TaxID=175537 RepID=UPI00374FAB5B
MQNLYDIALQPQIHYLHSATHFVCATPIFASQRLRHIATRLYLTSRAPAHTTFCHILDCHILIATF